MNKIVPSSKIFVYPQLPAVYDFGFIRFRGSGLANCLFVVSRAYIIAKKNNWTLIDPTWGNLSFGPYLRRENDKRHYFGQFKKMGVSKIQKLFLLSVLKKSDSENLQLNSSSIVLVQGLGNYFEDLLVGQVDVKSFIINSLRDKIKDQIDRVSFENIIGIHIRLGDFSSEMRTDINWYVRIVKDIFQIYGSKYTFQVFSDGSDSELVSLLSLPSVERVFYGNAISDILALSRCRLIIGSDSTFSAWGSYLGQVPVIFPKKHFGRVLVDETNEYIDQNKSSVQFSEFLSKVLK